MSRRIEFQVRVSVIPDDAVAMCKRLTRYGLFVGPFPGAFVYAALQVAARERFKVIVTVLNDAGGRYVPTGMWMPEAPARQGAARDLY